MKRPYLYGDKVRKMLDHQEKAGFEKFTPEKFTLGESIKWCVGIAAFMGLLGIIGECDRKDGIHGSINPQTYQCLNYQNSIPDYNP